MNHIDIKEAVGRKNAIYVLSGILFSLLSISCWCLSYWIFWYLFFIPLKGFNIESAKGISTYMALGSCLLLLLEGYRYGKPQLNLVKITRDLGVTINQSGRAGFASYNSNAAGYSVARTLATAYIISSILFCAPRSSIHAIKSFLSIIRLDPEMLTNAENAISTIAEKNKWIKTNALCKDEAALNILHRIGMIRFRDNEGLVEAGLSPKARKLLDVDFPNPNAP